VADIFLDTSYLETLEAKALLETPLVWGAKLLKEKRDEMLDDEIDKSTFA
jgi:hypothetical protein